MDDIYYQKYLKYKNKYLSLKADIDEQYAGAEIDPLYIISADIQVFKQGVKKDPSQRASEVPDVPFTSSPLNGKEISITLGTLTDTREHVQGGKIVKGQEENPYLSIRVFSKDPKTGKGKNTTYLHQIAEAYGTRDPRKIVNQIKEVERTYPKVNLDALKNNKFVVFDKPCFSGPTLSKKCQPNRGELTLKLGRVKYEHKAEKKVSTSKKIMYGIKKFR